MWFIRAIFPLGACLVVLGTFTPYVMIAGVNIEFEMGVTLAYLAIYIGCMFLTLKEAFGVALIGALLSSGYGALLHFLPVLNFNYSGYVYATIILVLIVAWGGASERKEKSAVVSYFLRREAGTVADLVRETGLAEEVISKHIRTLQDSGKIELIVPELGLYKWTENLVFPEGMSSEEIEISF